jgi:hypothetical protein
MTAAQEPVSARKVKARETLFPGFSRLKNILWEGWSILPKCFRYRVSNKFPESFAKQIEDQLQPVHGDEYAEDEPRVSGFLP